MSSDSIRSIPSHVQSALAYDVMYTYYLALDARIHMGAALKFYKLDHTDLLKLNFVVRPAKRGWMHLFRLTEVHALARAVHLNGQPNLKQEKLRKVADLLELRVAQGCDSRSLRALILEHIMARTPT